MVEISNSFSYSDSYITESIAKHHANFPHKLLKMVMSDTKENLLHKHIISLVNKKNCVNWKQDVLGASKEP